MKGKDYIYGLIFQGTLRCGYETAATPHINEGYALWLFLPPWISQL
jgi:hypothetical protein